MTTKMRPRAAVATVLGVLACGGCNGSTQPPNPPFQLVISGGNAQSWYFNNPLPTPLSVTALDVDGLPVAGVLVTWTATSGGVNPLQSTTDANGIATTIDSIGSSTLQTVSATFAGLSGPVSFTEFATTPPTSQAVAVKDNFFDKANVVVQVNGTVTWTFVGAVGHTVTFPGGPDSGNPQIGGTFGPETFTTVGTKSYYCKVHGGTNGSMNGSVTVVH
jgi:plastocyanin